MSFGYMVYSGNVKFYIALDFRYVYVMLFSIAKHKNGLSLCLPFIFV